MTKISLGLVFGISLLAACQPPGQNSGPDNPQPMVATPDLGNVTPAAVTTDPMAITCGTPVPDTMSMSMAPVPTLSDITLYGDPAVAGWDTGSHKYLRNQPLDCPDPTSGSPCPIADPCYDTEFVNVQNGGGVLISQLAQSGCESYTGVPINAPVTAGTCGQAITGCLPGETDGAVRISFSLQAFGRSGLATLKRSKFVQISLVSMKGGMDFTSQQFEVSAFAFWQDFSGDWFRHPLQKGGIMTADELEHRGIGVMVPEGELDNFYVQIIIRPVGKSLLAKAFEFMNTWAAFYGPNMTMQQGGPNLCFTVNTCTKNTTGAGGHG